MSRKKQKDRKSERRALHTAIYIRLKHAKYVQVIHRSETYSKRRRKKKRSNSWLTDWLWLLLVAVIIIILTVVHQPEPATRSLRYRRAMRDVYGGPSAIEVGSIDSVMIFFLFVSFLCFSRLSMWFACDFALIFWKIMSICRRTHETKIVMNRMKRRCARN